MTKKNELKLYHQNGEPVNVRCFMNKRNPIGDCYTVVYTYARKFGYPKGIVVYRAMCANPYHPLGHGYLGDAPRYKFAPGGSKIAFSDLPPDCKKVVLDDYASFWGKNDVLRDESGQPIPCVNHDECGASAVYTLTLVNDSDIHVCESCDENYTACINCGKQDEADSMRYIGHDEWPTCDLCQNEAIFSFFNCGTVSIEQLQSFMGDYFPEYTTLYDEKPWETYGYEMVEPAGKRYNDMDDDETVVFVKKENL